LQRFKKVTSGHTIVMWRKTFESIGRKLPNRRNIVLTRKWNIDGVETYSSIEELLEKLFQEEIPSCKIGSVGESENNVFIIGWSEIYKQFLWKADYLDITEIKKNYDWDTFFPEFKEKYKEIAREKYEKFDFVRYKKI
jgi:dihydrofolate reductase